eukprot:SAG11_NODE_854_length_6864_cov_6.972087_5_plen_298_part_00
MEPKSQFSKEADIPASEYYIPFGVANIVRLGVDVTLVACGAHVHTCLASATLLSSSAGIDCEVVDLRTLVPLDTETVIRSVAKTGRLLVVDEAYSMCGVGAEVVAVVTAAPGVLAKLKAPPGRLHTAASAMPFANNLEEEVQVTEPKVTSATKRLVQECLGPEQHSRPLTTAAAVAQADAAAAPEAVRLAGTMTVMTPYRVGDVSYWFGIPVTMLEWFVASGASVAEGEALARIQITAEDLNKPGSTVDTEVDVVAPAAGTLGEILVTAGALTELGKPIAMLVNCHSAPCKKQSTTE